LSIAKKNQVRMNRLFRTMQSYAKAIIGGAYRKNLWKQLYTQEKYRHPSVLEKVLDKSLLVCITYKCNIACEFCYSHELAKTMPDQMSLDSFKKLINWAKEMNFSFLRFAGGEPTVHPKFLQMIDVAYKSGIFTRISTNNVFSAKMRNEMISSGLKHLTINYVFDSLNSEQRELFEENLAYYHQHSIPFKFSYVLNKDSVERTKLFEHAKKYRPVDIRSNIVIPGLSGKTSINETKSRFKLIAAQIFDMQSKFMRMDVPFYLYMPVFRCLFDEQEWKRLKGFFPNMLFTRCFVGARGNFAAMTVVNPDLSTYPCPAVFLQGPSILSFKNKKQISDYFKEKLRPVLLDPVMQACPDCEKFKNFTSDIKNCAKETLESAFSDAMCQGGCLNYRKNFNSTCQME